MLAQEIYTSQRELFPFLIHSVKIFPVVAHDIMSQTTNVVMTVSITSLRKQNHIHPNQTD